MNRLYKICAVVLLALLAAGMLLAFSACAPASEIDGKENDLIGAWYSNDFMFEFYKDKDEYHFSAFYMNESAPSTSEGTYTAGSKYLILHHENSEDVSKSEYRFCSDGTLELFNGKTVIAKLTKRK